MSESAYDKLAALSRELQRPINRPEIEKRPQVASHPVTQRDCIFCNVSARTTPSYIFDENEDFVAFLDIQPKAVGHAVIAPKVHVGSLESFDGLQSSTLLDFVAKVTKTMKKTLGITGYTMISMNGLSSGQAIDHYSLHIIPTYAQESIEMHITSQLQTQKLPPFVLKDVHAKLVSIKQLVQNTRLG